MTCQEFVNHLNGFVEITSGAEPTPAQWGVIKRLLQETTKREIQPRFQIEKDNSAFVGIQMPPNYCTTTGSLNLVTPTYPFAMSGCLSQ